MTVVAGHARRSAAFTIVELLVAVAIIALLLSVLLPALSGARAQAAAVVCASNLRQLVSANLYYSADHVDRLAPGAADFRINLHRWHGARSRVSEPFEPRGGALTNYLSDDDGAIRRCPALRIELDDRDWRRFERNAGGYGYNNDYLGVDLRWDPRGFWIRERDVVGARVDTMKLPTQTLMFADAALVNGELVEYSFAHPQFVPTQPTIRYNPSLHFRHQDEANIGWSDGHVARRRFALSGDSIYGGSPEAERIGWFDEPKPDSAFIP